MRTISTPQLRALHAACKTAGMDDEARHALVYSFTDGRTQSSKGLSFEEAQRLLSSLNGKNSEKVKAMLNIEAKRLVKQIYSLSFKIPFLNEHYSENDTPEDVEMNKAKISVWTRKYTACKKPVSRMSIPELEETVTQMQKIARKLNTQDD
jgi:hypothetical protein